MIEKKPEKKLTSSHLMYLFPGIMSNAVEEPKSWAHGSIVVEGGERKNETREREGRAREKEGKATMGNMRTGTKARRKNQI
jgi:hypothetical protein